MLFVDNKKVKAPVLSPTTIQYQSITAVDELLLQAYLDGQSASIIFYLQINMHKRTHPEKYHRTLLGVHVSPLIHGLHIQCCIFNGLMVVD